MHIFTLHIGNLTIAPTWYGLMYVLGFVGGYIFMKRVIPWKKGDHLDAVVWYVFLGVILWGRLGYVILYHPDYFLSHPLDILKVWEGGMSFHGGLIGVITSIIVFGRRYGYWFWYVIDRLAVYMPIALGMGRIGNWINQELPGYAPYSGIFPMMIDGQSHFPSPLFEMFCEGILLGGVMLIFYYFTTYKDSPRRLSGVFLLGYGIARLLAEQFRLPDAHIGYLLGTNWLTLGILYSIPMVIIGILLILQSKKNK